MDAMPVTLGVVSPLVLTGVLVLSGLAKLRHTDTTRSAIVALRLPPAVDSPWVARALPVAELAIAVGLVSPWLPIARYAAWAALALFAAYLVVIARALTFKPRPNCACFGRLGRSQVDGWTLLRNVVLLQVAASATWFTWDGHTVPAALPLLDASAWPVIAGAALGAVLLVVARPRARSEGANAEVGTPVMAEEATGGAAPSVLGARSERPTMLVLVDCHCGPTYRAARELSAWQADRPDVNLRLVFCGIEPLTPDEGGASPDATWRDEESAAWTELGLSTSPSAVLVGADGRVAAGPVAGWDDVVAFVHGAGTERDHGRH